ncbi:hypothetical protein OGATHE_005309 [Ogataea polymorpha]|uniref:Uncharacterized protein n=1 Tax=Ogataea polymorpha TaxID=460523 RepID=A0A9P8NWN7_9ASCO|nr:hypothetical protein OGATHE_005309 [Ogataea polymorpha]
MMVQVGRYPVQSFATDSRGRIRRFLAASRFVGYFQVVEFAFAASRTRHFARLQGPCFAWFVVVAPDFPVVEVEKLEAYPSADTIAADNLDRKEQTPRYLVCHTVRAAE